MRKWIPLVVIACAAGGAQAQSVYKCNPSSYSEQPCSSRVVRTYEAPVDVPLRRPRDVVAHRLPGETGSEMALRQRRIALTESDRDECARLDRKIPFEQQRIKNGVNQDEIDDAQDSLAEGRKRFGQLRC